MAPDPAPWADAVVTPVFPHPVIAKTATGSIAYIGESHEFTIVVTNDGDAPATSVVLNDLLPPNWDYDAGSATVGLNGAAGAASEPTVSDQNLNWGVLPDLGVDGYVTVVYTATPNAGAAWDATNTVAATTTPNAALTRFQDEGGAPENAAKAHLPTGVRGQHRRRRADRLCGPRRRRGTTTRPSTRRRARAFSWTLTVTNAAGFRSSGGPDRRRRHASRRRRVHRLHRDRRGMDG